MFNTDILAPFIVFSVIIQQLVEIGYTLVERVPVIKSYINEPEYKEWKKIATFLTAIVFGGILGFLLRLNLVAALGVVVELPEWILFIVTGVIVGAGAPFIHSIIKVMNVFSQGQIDYDELVQNIKDELNAELENL